VEEAEKQARYLANWELLLSGFLPPTKEQTAAILSDMMPMTFMTLENLIRKEPSLPNMVLKTII
jgi:hypothetical protein